MAGALAVALAGCAGTAVKPLTEQDNRFGRSPEEQRLLTESRLEHDTLRKRGLLMADPALLAYLEGIGQSLVPAGVASPTRFRFHVLKAPVVNAFALPTGDIYLSVALLSRLDDEAELALVLAHEITHVIQRHAYQRLETQRSGLVAAHIADLLLFGTSIAYLPYMTSMAAFSREHETEADAAAVESVRQAGYDLDEAADLFERLSEVKKGEELSGSAYSTHPGNLARMAAARARIQALKAPPGRVGRETYQGFRRPLMFENIRLKLQARQYEIAHDAASEATVGQPEAPMGFYLRGEARRRMAEDPKGAAREHAWLYDVDDDEALEARMAAQRDTWLDDAGQDFATARRLDPGFWLALRGQGLVALAQGESAQARESLSAYLSHVPEARDRLYIEHLIQGVEP